MAEWRVSDEAFAEATRGSLLTRDQYRKIKGYNRRELELYIASVYRSGFDGCAEAMQKKVEAEAQTEEETEEVKRDWEDVLRMIAEVRGMTPEMLTEIDERMRAV